MDADVEPEPVWEPPGALVLEVWPGEPDELRLEDGEPPPEEGCEGDDEGLDEGDDEGLDVGDDDGLGDGNDGGWGMLGPETDVVAHAARSDAIDAITARRRILLVAVMTVAACR